MINPYGMYQELCRKFALSISAKQTGFILLHFLLLLIPPPHKHFIREVQILQHTLHPTAQEQIFTFSESWS